MQMSDSAPLTKILFLASNPKGTNKLRLDEEARDIQEGLRQAKDREKFEIVSEWAVRPRDIRRAILYFKPNVVHFSGHSSEDTGLAFEGKLGKVKLVSPEALAGLFRLLADHVECVVLNSCYSELQADAIAAHIDYVIGMKQEIGDLAAIEFSVGFYDSLASGYSIEQAYEFGCNAIQIAGIAEHSTPILKKRGYLVEAERVALSTESKIPIDGYTEPLDSQPSTLSSQKTEYTFVLSSNGSKFSDRKIEAIAVQLRSITGDSKLTVTRVKQEDKQLTVESSDNGFRVVRALILLSELNEIGGYPIQEVYCTSAKTDAPFRNQVSTVPPKVLSKYSGRDELRVHLQELGFKLSNKELDKVLQKFQKVSRKKSVSDSEIEILAKNESERITEYFTLESIQVYCGSTAPTATITMRMPDGEAYTDASVGTGPVNAVYKAISRISNLNSTLIEYSAKSVAAGSDTVCEVKVQLLHGRTIYSGYAADTDIVAASAYAYINAVNRWYSAEAAVGGA